MQIFLGPAPSLRDLVFRGAIGGDPYGCRVAVKVRTACGGNLSYLVITCHISTEWAGFALAGTRACRHGLLQALVLNR